MSWSVFSLRLLVLGGVTRRHRDWDWEQSKTCGVSWERWLLGGDVGKILVKGGRKGSLELPVPIAVSWVEPCLPTFQGQGGERNGDMHAMADPGLEAGSQDDGEILADTSPS